MSIVVLRNEQILKNLLPRMLLLGFFLVKSNIHADWELFNYGNFTVPSISEIINRIFRYYYNHTKYVPESTKNSRIQILVSVM